MDPMTLETNKLAAGLIAQQVAAYDAELKNLEQHVQMLQARKDAVLLMRQALQALIEKQLPLIKPENVLAKAMAAPEKPSLGLVLNASNLAPVTTPNAGAISLNGGASIAKPGTGFADAVRAVLRENPKGLVPKAVAKQMQVKGTAELYKGSTPFNVRVGNELHRLMKAEEVGRHSGRYYLITQEQHQ
jgi:hypothetical protein